MITPDRTRALSLAVVACLLLVACAADRNASSHAGTDANPDQVPAGDTAPADDNRNGADRDDGGSHEDDPTDDDQAAGDQRAVLAGAPLPGTGTPGVDIVMGEWALVPSVAEAPPGTTTFRFRNMGTVPHALRIRTPGSGRDRLEWRSEIVRPDQAGLLVADLAPGTYEVDCPVEDGHGEHDQLGMEIRFTIAVGAAELAPLPGPDDDATADADDDATADADDDATADAADAPGAPDTPGTPGAAGTGSEPSDAEMAAATVDIRAFAFQPAELRVPVGTEVMWTNRDPAPHTVTHDDFDTGTLDEGASESVTFDTPGTFDYICAIHPTMQARVVVEP